MIRTALIFWIVVLVAPAQGSTLEGRLTGSHAAWGPTRVEALPSRDLTIPAVGHGVVQADGRFEIALPGGTEAVYLALWPEQGGAYPLLLRELPYAVPPEAPIVIALPAPPKHRAERQAMAGPSFWIVAAVALGLLGLLVWGGRRLLAGRAGLRPDASERWIPRLHRRRPGGWILVAIVSLVGGLLLWGTLVLGEAMDLLEYTYFQEGFSGTNPLRVAFSPVVAERAHAPGYAVLMWVMTRLSSAETWLRLPAVAASMAGAWLLYRLAQEGTGSRTAGWIAALLGGLAPLAMRYGRDVTPYGLVGMLAVASTWLLHRAITTGERRPWLGYAAVSVGGFFLHYFTAFLVLGQAVAGAWLWLRGGRGAFWSGRFRQALLWFGALGVLPLLWTGQVVRAFLISAQDNLVTHAVYPEAPSFLVYTVNHLRVLLGLPPELSWLVWPMIGLVVVAYVVLLRDHPTFGRLLLIPFILMLGLLATTYLLHSYAYGGRIYYGWRWLRPYTAAVAVPIAWLMVRAMPSLARAAVLGLGGLLVGATLFSGTTSALTRERPAQSAAAEYLLERAEDGDAVGVLPAAFYTVGWSYYLHDRAPKYIHPGPSIWQYFPRDGGHVRVFGPIRTFGIPLESYLGHVDIRRLWVTDFDERLFGEPEFDEVLPAHVLSSLDERADRLLKAGFPYLQLYLYDLPRVTPWQQERLEIDLSRLYRALRWLPRALDPDYLFQVVRGAAPVHLKLPSPPANAPVQVRVEGAPAEATPADVRIVAAPRSNHPGEARLQPPPPEIAPVNFAGGTWRTTVTPTRSDAFELIIERSDAARAWPLRLVLTPR